MAAEIQPTPSRMPGLALAFAVAALLACWNPVAAPFGLVVGIVAALLGWRALARRRGHRPLAVLSAALGGAAALASAVVLAMSAGSFGVELPGAPIVSPRTGAEAAKLLDEAAARTRAARERAERELSRLSGEGAGGGPGGARDGGAAPAPARGTRPERDAGQ